MAVDGSLLWFLDSAVVQDIHIDDVCNGLG